MRNEMFFIDGELVDLDDDTKITLNIKSNIFSDVSKIISNNTYSIKLPMTVRNCRIIDNAQIPSYGTRYPRINHAGRYFRNGVEIVPDANVVLLEIGETIDVAMAWGNVSTFSDIVNEGLKLQDLTYGDVEDVDYVVWRRGSSSQTFPRVEYGFSSDEQNVWYHPVVTAKWILDKISFDSGVIFTFPNDLSDYLEHLIVPLLTRNDSTLKSEENKIQLKPVTLISRQDSGWNFGFETVSISNYYLKNHDVVVNGKDRYTGGLIVNFRETSLHLKGKIIFCINTASVNDDVRFEVLNNSVSLLSVTPTEVTPLANGKSEIIFELDNDTDRTKNAGTVTGLIDFSLQGASSPIASENVSGSIDITPKVSYVSVEDVSDKYKNANYYLVPNLPNMTQIDFIKAVSAICGCFAMPSSTGIKFVTIDDIISNKQNALDWTKRVVASFQMNRPKLMSFSIDGFAQKNIYKWKDDEDCKYDGIIYVYDDTIDKEIEALTLPFEGSETSEREGYYGCANIPLYSYGADGELEYNDNISPRLLLLTNKNDGVFTGLDWKTIIENRYKEYQNVIMEPKVITELIEIRDFELKELDLSIPIYLAQYGRYYAIISIKAENTGICECKLLQLEV